MSGEANQGDDPCAKLKGMLTSALLQVQLQVHAKLTVKDEALSYIESLILRLLRDICASKPHTIADVDSMVEKTFPKALSKWVLKDSYAAVERKKKDKKERGITLPVDRVHPIIKELLGYKVDYPMSLFIVAVMESVAADILKLTGIYVVNMKGDTITFQNVKVAMSVDEVYSLSEVLMCLFGPGERHGGRASGSVGPRPSYFDPPSSVSGRTLAGRRSVTSVRTSGSALLGDGGEECEPPGTPGGRASAPLPKYEDVVKQLFSGETQYVRELSLIIKVFRKPFVDLFNGSKDIEVIFSNIVDVHQLAFTFLSLLEDHQESQEISEQDSPLLVGTCFEDSAEYAEFDVYEKYLDEITRPTVRDRLNTLLKREDMNEKMAAIGPWFMDTARYLLPDLLLTPVYHLQKHFETIKILRDLTESSDDKESFIQTAAQLVALKKKLDKFIETSCRDTHTFRDQEPDHSQGFLHRGRQVSLQTVSDMLKTIEGWEDTDIHQCCNKIICEGALLKQQNRKSTDRYAFLFDGLLVLCKQNHRASNYDFRYKEKFLLKKIDIVDRADSDDLKNCFEIHQDGQSLFSLATHSREEKGHWMSALTALQNHSNLDKVLDGMRADEARSQPTPLPHPDVYPFAEPDSEENLVIEEGVAPGDPPVIKGGSLVKLVERLTYHTYADPKFVRVFLLTYRSFCKPPQLLDLLIKRFKIPELNLANLPDSTDSASSSSTPIAPSAIDDTLAKRYRADYCKPVQMRVLNTLRFWVDQHYYDFEKDPELLVALQHCLEDIKGKRMKKWAGVVTKSIQRQSSLRAEPDKMLTKEPPHPEWWLYHPDKPDDFEMNILTLHPVEIARQATLLEFDLFRAVKPTEVYGKAWMKEDKEKTSPNLLRLIRQSNGFIYWLEKSILEHENAEERVAVYQRVLEILSVFQELNNFNGTLEVLSALQCASVYRLNLTYDLLPNKCKKVYEEARELWENQYKKYLEKLRSINPPCVPFLGVYLSNFLKFDDGNPDSLPNGLINFTKRTRLAEIIYEIQQYQHQPYCITVVPEIRRFLDGINPFDGAEEKDFEADLFEKSLVIQPRQSKNLTKFPRKIDYPLKSPGTKTTNRGSVIPTTAFSRLHLPTIDAARHFTFGKHPEEDDTEPLIGSSSTPPTTPNTPKTPPHAHHSNGGVSAQGALDRAAGAKECLVSNASQLQHSHRLHHQPSSPLAQQRHSTLPLHSVVQPKLQRSDFSRLAPPLHDASLAEGHKDGATGIVHHHPTLPARVGGSLSEQLMRLDSSSTVFSPVTLPASHHHNSSGTKKPAALPPIALPPKEAPAPPSQSPHRQIFDPGEDAPDSQYPPPPLPPRRTKTPSHITPPVELTDRPALPPKPHPLVPSQSTGSISFGRVDNAPPLPPRPKERSIRSPTARHSVSVSSNMADFRGGGVSSNMADFRGGGNTSALINAVGASASNAAAGPASTLPAVADFRGGQANRRNSGDHVNVNGFQAPLTPQLPPKTYRTSHARQQSH